MQQDLSITGADLKLVNPENLHFTLHFLGNVEPERITQLGTMLDEMEADAFKIHIVGLGVFRPSRPRIIWVSVTTGSEELIRLQQMLGNNLRQHQFPIERRQYSPHLTIARVRSGRSRTELMNLVNQQSDYDFGWITAKNIKLKQSTLTPKGPIYKDLKIKALSQS